jgi:hypothetical protein
MSDTNPIPTPTPTPMPSNYVTYKSITGITFLVVFLLSLLNIMFNHTVISYPIVMSKTNKMSRTSKMRKH